MVKRVSAIPDRSRKSAFFIGEDKITLNSLGAKERPAVLPHLLRKGGGCPLPLPGEKN
jgi:hypothetical protein